MNSADRRPPTADRRPPTTLVLGLLLIFTTGESQQPPELALARQSYEKQIADRVVAPFESAVAELNSKFLAALGRAATEAKAVGDLPLVLAFESDAAALSGAAKGANPIPPSDAEDAPESLKRLRAVYRDQYTKLLTQRDADRTKILPGYIETLKRLEGISRFK
jgi:hypothetical protein